MNRELLRVAEVSRLTGLSRGRIYEALRRGLLPSVRIGRQVFVARLQLDRFIEDGGRGLSATASAGAR